MSDSFDESFEILDLMDVDPPMRHTWRSADKVDHAVTTQSGVNRRGRVYVQRTYTFDPRRIDLPRDCVPVLAHIYACTCCRRPGLCPDCETLISIRDVDAAIYLSCDCRDWARVQKLGRSSFSILENAARYCCRCVHPQVIDDDLSRQSGGVVTVDAGPCGGCDVVN